MQSMLNYNSASQGGFGMAQPGSGGMLSHAQLPYSVLNLFDRFMRQHIQKYVRDAVSEYLKNKEPTQPEPEKEVILSPNINRRVAPPTNQKVAAQQRTASIYYPAIGGPIPKNNEMSIPAGWDRYGQLINRGR